MLFPPSRRPIYRLIDLNSTRNYKNTGHDSFDLSRLDLLLQEEVMVCAPDPLVSSFYVCVVLRNLRLHHHVFSEELKNVQYRLERFAYKYLDLCKNTWEARALVTKEGLICYIALTSSENFKGTTQYFLEYCFN